MNPLYIFIFVGFLSFFFMKKEKANIKTEAVDNSPLQGGLFWKVLLLEIASPIIAQSVFYYGWKKKMPKKAAKANSIGWLVFLGWIVVAVVF